MCDFLASIVAAQRGGEQVVSVQRSNIGLHVKSHTKEGVAEPVTLADNLSNIAMAQSFLITFPWIRVVSEEKLPIDGGSGGYRIHFHDSDPLWKELAHIPDGIELNQEELVVWIDPLDATKEYGEGLTQYVTTMVCVAHRGRPLVGVIHRPFTNQTYWASKFGSDKRLLPKLSTSLNDPLRLIISRSHKGTSPAESLLQPNVQHITIEAAGSGYKGLELLSDHADLYLHRTYIKKWDVCAVEALVEYGGGGWMRKIEDNGKLDYSFQSDSLIREGIWATVKRKLMSEERKKFVVF